MLNSLDLFSGYGGIALGLREYCKPIGYCEIDRYAQGILASRISSGELPIAPIYPDITKLRGEIGAADILTGGFPCQDISVAGHGVGLEGKRSGLFFEIVRLTKEVNPPFVFLENVPAIRTRGLREIIRAFTEIGYDCRWTCLSAASVGAPHKRERWFLLAHNNGTELRNSKKSKRRRKAKFRDYGEKEPLAYTQESDDGKYLSREDERQIQQFGISPFERNVTDSNGIGLQSWFRARGHKSSIPTFTDSSWWEAEPSLGRVVDGCPSRVDRIKALGNGVVPLQVEAAFKTLIGIK